jgi:hypothetical protein
MFQVGREAVENFEGLGSPVTMKTDENVVEVSTFVRTDRRLGIRIMTES